MKEVQDLSNPFSIFLPFVDFRGWEVDKDRNTTREPDVIYVSQEFVGILHL